MTIRTNTNQLIMTLSKTNRAGGRGRGDRRERKPYFKHLATTGYSADYCYPAERFRIYATRSSNRDLRKVIKQEISLVGPKVGSQQIGALGLVLEAVCHAMNAGMSPQVIAEIVGDATAFGDKMSSIVTTPQMDLGVVIGTHVLIRYVKYDEDSGTVIFVSPGDTTFEMTELQFENLQKQTERPNDDFL